MMGAETEVLDIPHPLLEYLEVKKQKDSVSNKGSNMSVSVMTLANHTFT